ncbi:MAG: phosphoribosylformylglycinamidine cyclo-ligase, partial [Alphaproteobacteria bacterium]|nr:phosphoribosylformylglycinamidine cyclo-ligase [Alphaproteobacteria bacterium]
RVKRVVTGMAHVTGGGIADNLKRCLPGRVDAKIDRSAWDVPPVFRFLQKHGRLDDAELDRVFNLGIGYCMVVRPGFADSITRQLERAGEKVYRLGEIVRGEGQVVMQ